MAPLAPTKDPVIIKSGFPKVNPIPHAAHPEQEFSIDTTTGISAPPIGIIIRTPIISETINTPQKAVSELVVTKVIIRTNNK